MSRLEMSRDQRRLALAVVTLALWGTCAAALAQETITPLATINVSTTTADKPQAKLWFHAGTWWAVLPSTSVSPSGTWLWRLEPSHQWTNVLRLSTSTSARADARVVGDVAHVLLFGSSSQLVSVAYVAAGNTYQLWPVRPTATSVSLSGSETATIDIDSTGRFWLSTESGSNVHVYYGDSPYSTFSGPVVLASNIGSDDITVVTSLAPDPAIGVFWSNQNTKHFGFRVHVDGTAANVWQADEVPASQSELNVGAGMADDHMNVKVGSDGTLYAAIKTSYNNSSFPLIALLVRRPNGRWDNLYPVDTGGTRGIVLLNEAAKLIRVVFTTSTGGGNIVYRDSPLAPIAFGPRRTLITGSLNNATSAKTRWTDQVVVIASGRGVLFSRATTGTTTTTTATTTTTTTTTTSPGTSSTTTSTTTPTTVPAGGVTTYQAGVSGPAGSANVDTNIRLSTLSTNYGTDPDLFVGVTNGPTKVYRSLLAFQLAGIPAGATVTACTLTVNVTQRTNPTPGHVRRLCGEHWLDGEGQSEAQATWSNWKTATPWGLAGAGWTPSCAAGGDYTTAGEVAYTPPAGTGATGAFTFPDLAALCQDAISQRGGWLRLRISQDAESAQSNLIKFDSSDATTATQRPKLSVTWF